MLHACSIYRCLKKQAGLLAASFNGGIWVRTYVVGALLLIPCAFSNASETGTRNTRFQGVPPGAAILQDVIEAAQQSAAQTFAQHDHDLSDALKTMSYQTYRAIRFDPQHSVWRDQNDYEIQLFHPGFLYQQPVAVHIVGNDNTPVSLPFQRDAFIYNRDAAPMAAETMPSNGYAGFRVHYPIKQKQYKDEFAVFLGASYFRLVGANQVYGISARGLAIDTGLSEGEEFPHFTEYWLVEPAKGEPLTVYARLESPSVSGAYKFVIQPGSESSINVQSWLFARQDVNKLGIAPLTSMFLYGENSRHVPDDFRPEVHDSDGLLLHTQAGEQIWRPLTNPAHLQITSMKDRAPQGFGMLQRDTTFDNYLDAEANYHLRPGLWVSPESGFESGRLELVEIPSPAETNDNMVAYWVQDSPFYAGQQRYIAYTLSTVTGMALPMRSQPESKPIAQVIRTRQGAAVLPGETNNAANTRRFIIDFAIPTGLAIDPAALTAKAEVSHGTLRQIRVFTVDAGSTVRVSFLVTPQHQKTVDMRVFIHQHNQLVSEVWNYVYQAS